jgi:elongation factor P--(R)-beta-lysine ligase
MTAAGATVDWQPSAAWSALRLRADLLRETRAWFAELGVLEVETPCLAAAGVTDVHLQSLEVRTADGERLGYLQTSPEYAMKRLLAAGAPDIYQLGHVFRGAERGRRHNLEFTMVEWYRRGIDEHALMDEVEALLRRLLTPHRPLAMTRRLRYHQAVDGALGLASMDADAAALCGALQRAGIDVPDSLRDERDALLDLAISLLVAPGFPADRITFVHDFPASQAALARVAGPVAARFEAYVGELELANGFHELVDPEEQARRFAADAAERVRRRLPPLEPDARFLAALRAGLPPCSGVALGFDRVVMLALGADHIDATLAFPYERA